MKKMKTPTQVVAAAQMVKLVNDQAKKNGFKTGLKETVKLFITILKC